MSQIYVSEFLFRGRCPDNEPGQQSTFHVVLCRWNESIDGSSKPETLGPLTPEQASKMGYPLPTLLSDLNAQLMADLDAATARAAAAEQALEAAQTAPTLQEESGPSNPVLNTITFGLFGK